MAIMGCVACDVDLDVNTKDATLTDMIIKCINETTISNNTSSNKPFTKHTYLCTGKVGDYNGNCSIRIMHDNFILVDNHELTASGSQLPFQIIFAPEWGYLDNRNNEFIVMLLDDKGDTLCKTTVVVTEHSESGIAEGVDIPYMEYSLWDTSCEWQFPSHENGVIVVNSDNELSRYIVSESGDSYPSVDFEKYTMIIAHGYCLNGIAYKSIDSLKRVSDTDIEIKILLSTDYTDVVEPWTFALLVDKWSRLYNVTLNVDFIDFIN